MRMTQCEALLSLSELILWRNNSVKRQDSQNVLYSPRHLLLALEGGESFRVLSRCEEARLR